MCIHMTDIALNKTPFDPNMWVQEQPGMIVDGRMYRRGGRGVHAKHLQEFKLNDMWSIRVEIGEGSAIGFATTMYDPANHYGTYEHLVAQVFLDTGSTDGHGFYHQNQLKKHFPVGLEPYNMSIRINVYGMPQAMFNDGVWHDFLPEGSSVDTSTTWVPCVQIQCRSSLSEHHLIHPQTKPTKTPNKRQPI